ncbi:MAG: hypothetical protein ACLGG0_09975 [Bacteriovoracia bacterium]
MRCLIILLLFPIAHAQETSFLWYPNKTRFPEGECVQKHTPSNGDSFVGKARPEDCRPEKTSYLWLKDNCYEVDQETQGQLFGVRVRDIHKCAPADALYAFNQEKRECWLVDPSGGQKFRAKLNPQECRPPEDEIKKEFKLNQNGLGGECVEIHKTQGSARWEKRILVYECKPKNVTALWRKTGELKGECWLTGDTESYSEKVAFSSCRPKNVSYRFVRTSEKTGDCFEVDSETQGDQYASKVKPELCINQN